VKSKLIIIILLLLVGCAVYGFYYLFERYEEVKDLGWDKKAQRNPYLAAEQFLQKSGIKVTSSNNYDQLSKLPEQGMVFISNSSETLTRKRVDEIIEWIEQGGHLIIAAPIYDEDEEDILLSRFNVTNEYLDWDDEADYEEDDNTEQKADGPKKLSEQLEKMNEDIEKGVYKEKLEKSKKAKEEYKIPEAEITRLKFTDYEFQVGVHFSPASGLSHPSFYDEDEDEDEDKDGSQKPGYWTGSEYGTHFMQFDVGYGLLSVVSDGTVWRSEDIDKLDHAHLLWLLSTNYSEVILLYGANMPSIFYYFWKFGSEAVIMILVWLLVWLLYRSRRFGSIREPVAIGHRSIAEHINASAEYLWRDKKFEQMIEPLRNEVRHRLQLHYPNYVYLNDVQQTQLIHEHSHLDVERIEDAFKKEVSGDESEFTQIIFDLQMIRNTL